MAQDTTQQLAARAAPGASLSLVFPRASGRWIRIRIPESGEVAIGRDPSCAVHIDDASVSRTHARVTGGAAPCIVDVGSTNGTSVGGKRLAEGQSVPLKTGTVVELGSVVGYVQPATPDDVVGAFLAGSSNPAPRTEKLEVEGLFLDPAMIEAYAMLEVLAESAISVIILGETGVGKDVFAQALHESSPRRTKPFVKLNCAALPENLLEAELFGYEKGAFTGATGTKLGLFETADGGTMFLDEIGEMSLAVQAKLLRVLESGEVMRVGSVKMRKVDVRVVSATHRDLEVLVDGGQFRQDLFYRIHGLAIALPPLRCRHCAAAGARSHRWPSTF